MERELVRLLPYILIGMFVLGVLLFLLAMYQLRVRRTGAYWRLRRRAGERGGKLFLLSVVLMASSLVLALISGLGALAYRNVNGSVTRGPEDLYGIILSPTVTGESIPVGVTATPDSPIPASTEPPTVISPTETPAPTATPDFSALLNLTPSFNVTPRPARPEARLTVDRAADSDRADASGVVFHAGIRRIYLYISFDGMDNGVAWSRVLYRDGLPVQGNTLLWSLGASGSSAFFFGDESGYPAGQYEVRLYLGDRETSRFPLTLDSG